MKKQLVAVVMAGALMVSVSAGASADKGGNPNDNACHGQLVSLFTSEVGITPGHAAQYFETNAGDLNKLARLICEIYVS